MATVIAFGIIGGIILVATGFVSLIVEHFFVKWFLVGLAFVVTSCVVYDFSPLLIKKGWVQPQDNAGFSVQRSR